MSTSSFFLGLLIGSLFLATFCTGGYCSLAPFLMPVSSLGGAADAWTTFMGEMFSARLSFSRVLNLADFLGADAVVVAGTT